VSLRLHIEPGGERYFAFAKSKLRVMKEFMQQFDLKLLSRWYLVKPGERIWVQSLRLPVQGVFLDWIRITVKTGAAHLVVRTGLHEWTFFDWAGFALVETFDASAKVYAGSESAPFGLGTQICAAAGDKLLVGTGTDLNNGTSQYWIVDGGGAHALVAGPIAGTVFYEDALATATEGPWVRTGTLQVPRFAMWSWGTSTGDTPFTGEGWINTVVDSASFGILSQFNVSNDDSSGNPVGPPGPAGAGVPWVLGDDPSTGQTVQPESVFSSNGDTQFSNPATGGTKPDLVVAGSSGKLAYSGSAIFGTPARIWRVIQDAGILHVELCTLGMVKLAEVSLSPTAQLHGWVADDGQALVIGWHTTENTTQAWHVVEGTDVDGNPTLTATDVSNTGVLATVRGAYPKWGQSQQFVGWVFGAGIHLVNRAF